MLRTPVDTDHRSPGTEERSQLPGHFVSVLHLADAGLEQGRRHGVLVLRVLQEIFFDQNYQNSN